MTVAVPVPANPDSNFPALLSEFESFLTSILGQVTFSESPVAPSLNFYGYLARHNNQLYLFTALYNAEIIPFTITQYDLSNLYLIPIVNVAKLRSLGEGQFMAITWGAQGSGVNPPESFNSLPAYGGVPGSGI